MLLRQLNPQPVIRQRHPAGNAALVASCSSSCDMCVKYVCRGASSSGDFHRLFQTEMRRMAARAERIENSTSSL